MENKKKIKETQLDVLFPVTSAFQNSQKPQITRVWEKVTQGINLKFYSFFLNHYDKRFCGLVYYFDVDLGSSGGSILTLPSKIVVKEVVLYNHATTEGSSPCYELLIFMIVT
uniref:Uncharacterized protein n=1 Tax=Glossina austeni TaxID=7395 RepID=A0A1A9UUS5_GLOAU